MTKAEVISKISEKTGIEKAEVQATIESFFDTVMECLEDGDSVFIRSFGTFTNKFRAEKTARSFKSAKNGEKPETSAIKVDAHFIPYFKPAKEFMRSVKESKILQAELKKKA